MHAGGPNWCQTFRRDSEPHLAARPGDGHARRAGRRRLTPWTSGHRQVVRDRVDPRRRAARNRLRHPRLCPRPSVGCLPVHPADVRHRGSHDGESFRSRQGLDLGRGGHACRGESGPPHHLRDGLRAVQPRFLLQMLLNQFYLMRQEMSI